MADALATRHAAQQSAEEELRELNATLELRIEQRTVELEGAVRAKSQFLANMSHEIRTPLNGVLGMLELVRQTELGPPQQRFIETARRSGETLLGVINGVLDLSKLEAGKIEIERSAFDLRIVVEEVTELFIELACGKGLELACFVPVALETALIGDAGRLRQILTNLIGNAVKFTEHGEVGVRVYAVERNASSVLIAFEVVDTGIGIPAEKRRHIFEAFAQADSSTTRRYGGTGLGLSIAKHFCEMMGGSIDVASEPGAGSKFRFTARFGLQPSTAGRIQNPMRIRTRELALVVVGNALSREILDDQLSAGNIQVRHAQSGLAALGALRTAALHKEPFELVIIDHSLPDMTGVELAHAIKTDSEGGEPQVILLTSFYQDVGQVANGVLRRLTKPIRQSALWECIGVSAEPVPAIVAAPKRPAPDQPGRGRAPVLIVEDSPVNLEVAVAILESMGCTVETAVNGHHALDRHANGEYSLIFMDCQMPEMDGFEATAEIRRREALSGRHTPIVALTASVVEDGRRRCLAVGMDDYLAKPFTLEQMSAMLTTWLDPPERPATREHLSLVTQAAAAPDPIDEQVLASIGRLQKEGRPDIVQELIQLFFKGAAGLLIDLDTGAATGDAVLLYRASHALKSASANLGADVLSTHCKELEALSKSGEVSDAARLVKAIREEYRTVEARLSDRLPRVA